MSASAKTIFTNLKINEAMKKFMKIKMVKSPIGRQFLLEWWYQVNGVNHLVDSQIVNDLKSWL